MRHVSDFELLILARVPKTSVSELYPKRVDGAELAASRTFALARLSVAWLGRSRVPLRLPVEASQLFADVSPRHPCEFLVTA